MLKKGDVILVVLALAGIAAGFGLIRLGAGTGDGAMTAVIKQGDRVIKTIDLNEVEAPEKLVITGDYTETVLIEKGRIRFLEADCPDQVCVKTGWLSKNGDMAVCLPNRAMIKIEGQSADVDGGTY